MNRIRLTMITAAVLTVLVVMPAETRAGSAPGVQTQQTLPELPEIDGGKAAPSPSPTGKKLEGQARKWGDDQDEMDCTRKMRYTWRTQKKLDALYHQIYMGYVNLIETYAYAGALTPQQKQTRLNMLKNYIQTFYNRRYQWCSEHEPDEWEEEWLNRDN